MFSSDEEETGSGSIIPGTPSDSDDDLGKISTPMVAKKNFKLHLKDFDLSVMEPAESSNRLNQTVMTAVRPVSAPEGKEKPTKNPAELNKTCNFMSVLRPDSGPVSVLDINKRRAPRIAYSSDEDDGDNDRSNKGSDSEDDQAEDLDSQRQLKAKLQRSGRSQPRSIRPQTKGSTSNKPLTTIAGTPSSHSDVDSASETLSSFEFEQEAAASSSSSSSRPKSKSNSKPSKSSSSSKARDVANARSSGSDRGSGSRRRTSPDDSTLLIDNLTEQVSQIGLGAGASNNNVDVDRAVADFDDLSIEEVSVRRVPKPIPEIIDIDDTDNDVQNLPESAETVPIPRQQQIHRPPTIPQSQPQRQMIFLPEPLPMAPSISLQSQSQRIPPAYIGEEMRGSLGNTILSLQKIISSIPKEDAVDSLGKPKLLKVDLYSHQRYGLMWLWWREQQRPYGGILADEMGLGKTVMILALICRGKSEGAKENNPDWRSVEKNKSLVPSRGTLVLCPASVMGQWESEVTKKARGLKVLVYHGQSRPKSASVLAQYDVVITTYNTLGSEIPKLSEQTAEACRSPMIRVSWLRIVLDEGHIIRNPKTAGSQAACRLTAEHRWIVTGTPVHNKPADMFSLIKFLRLTPFDDVKVWENWIGMKSVLAGNAERLHIIAKALLLRRTKDEVMAAQALEGPNFDGTAVQSIPPKTIKDIFVDLKDEEKEIYDHLNKFATAEFRAFLKSKQQRTDELQRAADQFMAGRPRPPRNIEEKSFTHIFTLILRLRQCSVLPHLIRTMIEEEDDADASEEYDPVEDLISMKNPVFAEDFQSGKLEKMYEDVDNLKRECLSRGERMDKVVIVSQWTSLLKIVERHLHLKGYSLTTISGEVLIRDRADIMGKFNADPKRPQIMLLSLAAGGVGLNLTGANHLFFLDIHWNPQLELQAQDRIHRFGQKKPVTIHRYISRGTIEEKVVALQQKKLELADGILNNAAKKNGGGLSIPEMRQLFGI